jgi:hypothetical protein
MKMKLTLSIDKNLIEKAKNYANNRHISLSKLIENYFKNIVENNDNEKNSPIVNELAGSIKNSKINLKEDYTEYLIKKFK